MPPTPTKHAHTELSETTGRLVGYSVQTETNNCLLQISASSPEIFTRNRTVRYRTNCLLS
uniref:Uncharacterized protein n=1 Tax=Arundo donax TaxID=35708 RepID=A0A0A9FDG7_ARUDO